MQAQQQHQPQTAKELLLGSLHELLAGESTDLLISAITAVDALSEPACRAVLQLSEAEGQRRAGVLKLATAAAGPSAAAAAAAAAAAGRGDEIGKKLEDVAKEVVEIKSLQMKAMSSTRHASSITPADFSMVESSLKIWWSIKGLEALSDKVCAVVGDGTEYTWEANTHEAKHKEQYMQILQDEVQLPGHLIWTHRVDQASILKTYLGTGGANLPFNIRCRTDALVVVRNAAVHIEGAIAATVEFKKRAVQQSILQAKITWVCASLNSHLPVLRVFTDMTDVFAAFYTDGSRDGSGRTICIQHMFTGRAELFAFMRNALSATSIPANVMRYCPDDQGREQLVLAEELPNPKRIKLPVPQQQHKSLWQDAMRVLAQHATGGSDIACLDDLEGFEDQDALGINGLAHKHSVMYT